MKRLRAWVTTYLGAEDILLEIIFGVLIVMTFTMAFKAADLANVPVSILSTSVNGLFVAAIGCTIAWGIIDAIITVMTNVAGRGRRVRLIEQIQGATSDAEAEAIVSGALEGELPGIIGESEREELYRHIAIKARDVDPQPIGVRRDDIYAAIGVILCAVLATLPVVVPLLFVDDPTWSIRISNIIGVVMLYFVGYQWAKYAGGKRAKTGLLLAAIGLIMMAIAIPLGG